MMYNINILSKIPKN